MKKTVLILLVMLIIGVITVPVFAGGGQNQGVKGKGNVHQKQIRNK